MFYVDLDEVEALKQRFNLISTSGWAPYQLRTSDHYEAGRRDIKQNILSYLQGLGEDTSTIGKISLLTHLRTFGHIFNPVSFYFVDDVSGKPLYSIAEVDNTFNEQKLFLLQNHESGAFRHSEDKYFYVSPFSDLDTAFHFRLKRPATRLDIGIDQSEAKNPNPYFRSHLSGTRKQLSDKALLGYSLRFPAITLGIVFSIHWQALLLWAKGIRTRKKSEHPEMQTNKHVYLKHRSHPTH